MDALEAVDQLTAAGVDPAQARVHARTAESIARRQIDQNAADKEDFERLRHRLTEALSDTERRLEDNAKKDFKWLAGIVVFAVVIDIVLSGASWLPFFN